jgi:hypothetical protein
MDSKTREDQSVQPETLLSYFLSIVGYQSCNRLDELAENLIGSFQNGMTICHPKGGEWFATLDAINPADNEVASLVRLSLSRSQPPKEVLRGMTDIEERGRELFTKPFRSHASENDDLLLTYSFPGGVPYQQNLDLFQEFARNELLRLRTRKDQSSK